MLSTLLSLRGGVMKPQVGCTTVRLVRDDESIQYIQEHHDDGGVIIGPNNPKYTNQPLFRIGGQLWRNLLFIYTRDSMTLSLLSTAVTHRVVHKVLINWRRAGGCRSYSTAADQYIYHHISVIRLSRASATLLAWATPYLNKLPSTYTNSLTTIDPLPWISIREKK